MIKRVQGAMVERKTVEMRAVRLAELVEATRLPTEQRPTVRMSAVVVTNDMLRIASAQ
jgi:hypothetical protein